ncbi:DedA family protein [Enterobacteriaceae endosymbiont of Macroplea appendiculata]|uniref:DedA family protein n=1 Tax=Enterobacteriaceae endosymbiont of Macroplea appendiculata TaxID=2675790 RepID=UPI001448EAB9|nr:DedA family protein [Enterobacteriaceae endosymbiont of Macroplea appendiculata]QJC30958.1 DedA family protein [Enterobacteriaceae endosymbiont of Macroplea appendiculata]
MLNFTKIITEYGYLVVFLGSLIEGETFIIIAGLLASKKILLFYRIVILAVCGSFIGVQLLFHIGHKYSKKILYFLKKYNFNFSKYYNIINNYPYIFILIVRFIYGLRLIGPIIIGITNVSKFKFALFNFIGAVIWAIIFTSAGYFFGGIITTLITDLNKIIKYIFLIITILISIKIIHKVYFKKK